jgi:hypothetical protein
MLRNMGPQESKTRCCATFGSTEIQNAMLRNIWVFLQSFWKERSRRGPEREKNSNVAQHLGPQESKTRCCATFEFFFKVFKERSRRGPEREKKTQMLRKILDSCGHNFNSIWDIRQVYTRRTTASVFFDIKSLKTWELAIFILFQLKPILSIFLMRKVKTMLINHCLSFYASQLAMLTFASFYLRITRGYENGIPKMSI